jgi:hypothetical protein
MILDGVVVIKEIRKCQNKHCGHDVVVFEDGEVVHNFPKNEQGEIKNYLSYACKVNGCNCKNPE